MADIERRALLTGGREEAWRVDKGGSGIISRFGPFLFAGAAYILAAIWVLSRARAGVREDIDGLGPILVLSFLLLALIVIIIVVRESRESSSSIFGSSGRLALIIGAAAFLIFSTIPPRTHRIYYDEDIYIQEGITIHEEGRAGIANLSVPRRGGGIETVIFESNKEPVGWPSLIAVPIAIGIPPEDAGRLLSSLLLALATASAVLVASSVHSTGAGVIAGLIFALLPEVERWSVTAAAEPAAAGLAALVILLAERYRRDGSEASLLASALLLIPAAVIRPEGGLLVPLFLIWIIPRRRELCRPGLTRWSLALVLVSLVLPILQIWVSGGETWGARGPKFSVSYIAGNLSDNLSYYIDGENFPRVASSLFIAGVLALGRRALRPLTWLVVFLGVFIPFYAGSYAHGVGERFSLLSFVPLAVIAGCGGAWIGGRFGRWGTAAVAATVVISWVFFLPSIRRITEEAWQARADHAAAEYFAGFVPEDALVLGHNPSMWRSLGRSGGQGSFATTMPEVTDYLVSSLPGGVYYHHNFWDEVNDPVQNAFGEAVLERYPHEEVTAVHAGYGMTFRLYRLFPRSGEEDRPG